MRSMGGEEYIGLHITVFTFTALISRPFSGKLTDTWGRIPVMVVGTVVTTVVSCFYPFFLNVFAFLAIRLIHGFSTGFKPTGTAAYVADILPKETRGFGMGILSFFGMTGMGLGNYIGGEIALHYSIDTLFFSSAAVALISVLVIVGMQETVQNRQRFSLDLLKVKRSEIYEPTVIVPSVVMVLVTFAFGTALTLAPDLSSHLGIQNKGLFFSYFTATSIVARVGGGGLSDRIGRRKVILAATITIALSFLIIGFASSFWQLMTGALVFGAGYGLSSPALFAWAADLSPNQFRGRGFSTLFMALEIGIGAGAFVAGKVYNGDPSNFPLVFGIAAFLAFAAFIYLLFQRDSIV